MKRLKKIFKWSGIVLAGLVATLLVANAWFVWTTDTRLERQLQEIRDTGDPLSLAELARPPIPPEKNAATYLRRAEADVMPIWKESGSILTVPEFPAHLMSAKQRDIAKKLFATHPELTSILEEAVNCPDYDAHLDYTRAPQDFIAQLLDVVQEERPVAWVARARAILLASEGQHDESARTGLIICDLRNISTAIPCSQVAW